MNEPIEPHTANGSVFGAQVAGHAAKLDGIEQQLRKLAEKTEPKFSTYVAGAGVLVGILGVAATIIIAFTGLMLAGYGRDLGRVERDTTVLSEDRVSLAYHRGIADESRRSMMKELDDLTLKAKDLDVALQREMGQLNATTEAKITATDDRLQQEIGVSREDRLRRISEMQTALDRLNAFQTEAAGIHAELKAKIEERKGP